MSYPHIDLAFVVEELLKLSSLWNLLIQPHIKKFYRGLKLLPVYAWKLSSDFSAEQAFWTRLQCVSQPMSGDPQLVIIRDSGQCSSIDVVEETSIQGLYTADIPVVLVFT